MEGQYPDWWKKKGTATNSKSKPTANIATAVTTGSSNGDGEFYALVTDTNPPPTGPPQ